MEDENGIMQQKEKQKTNQNKQSSLLFNMILGEIPRNGQTKYRLAIFIAGIQHTRTYKNPNMPKTLI